MRSGTVAIVGRTNVGKSTFLNAALGEDLAIVSPLPQTTRDTLLGIAHINDDQIAFIDTPGLHRPRTELGRRMNATAVDAARSTDLLVFMTDVSGLTKKGKSKHLLPDASIIQSADRDLLERLDSSVPTILVINKVDTLKNKTKLLPYIQALNEAHEFVATVPASVLKDDGVSGVLNEIRERLPEGKPPYDQSVLTDRPTTFFVCEYVREQILRRTRREVPHAVAVTVDQYDESPQIDRIHATIHVEKPGQRAILIGKGGTSLVAIGTSARERLEELLGRKVHLKLFIRVSERWKDMPRQLSELGYEKPSGKTPIRRPRRNADFDSTAGTGDEDKGDPSTADESIGAPASDESE
ncbi:MAG: GTPase Era [Polyangiaceae bacterium]|nr:GTPase Era [Polyangiaceae bacterium]